MGAVPVCAGEDLARGGDRPRRLRRGGRGRRRGPLTGPLHGLAYGLLRVLPDHVPCASRKAAGEAPGERQEAGAGGGDGRGGAGGRTAGEARADVLFGECEAAVQEDGGGGVAAQRPQRGEVVDVRAVPGAERLLQEREVAGGGAGQGGAVPGEVGDQEGAQPDSLAYRLVEGFGEPETVLDVLGRGGAGLEGEGERARRSTRSSSAPNAMPPRDPYGVGMRRRYALIRQIRHRGGCGVGFSPDGGRCAPRAREHAGIGGTPGSGARRGRGHAAGGGTPGATARARGSHPRRPEGGRAASCASRARGHIRETLRS